MSEQSPSPETPVPRVVFDDKAENGVNLPNLSENPNNPAIILNSASEEKDSLLFVEQPIDTVDALPSKKHYSNFDFLVGIISIVSYVFDLSMDIIVAVYFYHLGVSHGIYHYWYFGLTVTFILLPSLTMTGFSFRWYLMDADNSQLPEVPMWRWILRLIILMLQIAPILRYLDSMWHGLRSRWAEFMEGRPGRTPEEKDHYLKLRIKYYTLMVYEDADGTLLRLFECFMESAPQLVLQIYILIKDPHAIGIDERNLARDSARDSALKNLILVVSVMSSLFSLAWSLVAYQRNIRYTYPEKKNIKWQGSLCQFLWHFASITARVLALSLFASIHPTWIGPVCVAHWIVMSSWVVFQQTSACTTRCEEFVFSIVLGAVYVFSYFNAKEGRTRWKYLIYYSFCFVENTAMIVVWFLYANEGLPAGQIHWYFYPGIFGHYITFFAGIIFMVIYYLFFHPTGVEVDFAKYWARFRNVGVNEAADPAKKDDQAFMDLREMPRTRSELRSVKESANSRSTPALDELDAANDAKNAKSGALKAHQPVRRVSSAPEAENTLQISNRRTLKAMSIDRNKREQYMPRK